MKSLALAMETENFNRHNFSDLKDLLDKEATLPVEAAVIQ